MSRKEAIQNLKRIKFLESKKNRNQAEQSEIDQYVQNTLSATGESNYIGLRNSRHPLNQ